MTTEPTFLPFNPHGDLRMYVRNLPHWRQIGATYFVTFRQDDSIPANVLAQWLEVREKWYRVHGIDPRWKALDPDRFDAAYRNLPVEIRRKFEREQARMLHEELDHCHGSCVLRHREPRQLLRDAMLFFHGQRMWMGDFVLMPNHVHALVLPFAGWELEDLLGSVKKWTSRQIGQWLTKQPVELQPTGPEHNKPRFWQLESYDRIVRDFDELFVFRRYIARNPIAAKLRDGEYVYYAAAWLDAFAQRPTPP